MTILNIESLLQSLEDAINSFLKLALTQGRYHTADDRALLSLPPRMGGMGIIKPTGICQQEFFLATATKEQSDLCLDFHSEIMRTQKSEIKTQDLEGQQQFLDNLRLRMTPKQSCAN